MKNPQKLRDQETKTSLNTAGTNVRFVEFADARISRKKPRVKTNTQSQRETAFHILEKQILPTLRERAEREGVHVTDTDIQTLLHQRTRLSPDPFPVGVFLVAFIKDILDAFFTLSVFGIIIILPLSIIVSLILFFWVKGKLQGGWYKKKMIKYMWRRFFLTLCLESLPFFGIIPANTIFVYAVHKRDTRTVQILNEAAEILHRGGYMKLR